MISSKPTTAERATFLIKNGSAPAVRKESTAGKDENLAMFEDIFERVSLDDNGPLDRNRALNKVNYISRAPHGMNDWDFEYTENSLVRSSDGRFPIYEELRKENTGTVFISAGSGQAARVSYDKNTNQSLTESWTYREDISKDPMEVTLIPEEKLTLLPMSEWGGTPEVKEEKRRKLAEMAARLRPRRS